MAAASVLLCWPYLVSAAQAKKTTLFDVPGTPPGGSYPVTINRSGTIVGPCEIDGNDEGFVRNADGSFTIFAVPGAYSTSVTALNDKGQIAGWYVETNTGPYHGFIRDAEGTMTNFDISGAVDMEVTSINNSGTVVGSYDAPLFVRHGFIRDKKGNITTFDSPNSKDIEPQSVNDAGEIAGGSTGDDGTGYGFVRGVDGTITLFLGPNNSSATAVAIDKSGTATGYYRDDVGFGEHGFLRTRDGSISGFDAPGMAVTEPHAINGKGAVAGDTIAADNSRRGFVRNANGRFRIFKIGQYPNITTSGINEEGTVIGAVVGGDQAHNFVRTK